MNTFVRKKSKKYVSQGDQSFKEGVNAVERSIKKQAEKTAIGLGSLIVTGNLKNNTQ